jgi:hypothetical protein
MSLTTMRSMRHGLALLGMLTALCGCGASPCEEASELLRTRQLEVDALLSGAGCERVEDCKTVALGALACGGPSRYAVFCALSTDAAALEQQRVALEAQETEANSRCVTVSTCAVLQPPTPRLVAGVCTAQ